MAVTMGVFRGDRLRSLRLARELSQEELADLLTAQNGRTLPQQHVSRWESGRVDPSAEILVRLATLLDVSVDYLLGVVDEPQGRFVPDESRQALRERLNLALDRGQITEALEALATLAKGSD